MIQLCKNIFNRKAEFKLGISKKTLTNFVFCPIALTHPHSKKKYVENFKNPIWLTTPRGRWKFKVPKDPKELSPTLLGGGGGGSGGGDSMEICPCLSSKICQYLIIQWIKTQIKILIGGINFVKATSSYASSLHET